MTAAAVAAHGMIPGSHERPGGAECRCGAEWSWWHDMCIVQHVAAHPERYAGREWNGTEWVVKGL